MKAGTEEEALNMVKIRDKMTAQKAKDSYPSRVKNITIHRNLIATLVMKDILSQDLSYQRETVELPFLRLGPQCTPSSTSFKSAHNHFSFCNSCVISLGTDTLGGCERILPKIFQISFKKSTQQTLLFKILAFHAAFSSLTPLKK